MKNIVLIVGTRPNFMKAAPIYLELVNNVNYTVQIVHTGQHYDYNMSDIFFKQLELSDALITFLNIKNGSQNTQIANILLSLEELFTNNRPDIVMVFGDVTSTLAGALTCNKMGIRVCHIEAGNRSFDKTMPEEVNRILTDSLCDYHFVAEPYAMDNLRNEGLIKNEILEGGVHAFYVGNTMIDTLLKLKTVAVCLNTYQDMGLSKNNYVLVTLHRPHNVDDDGNLEIIFDALYEVATNMNKKIVFPIHPRKKEKITNMIKYKYKSPENIILCEPLGYLEFMNLNINCGVLLTDSGGLQEETTVLKKPCITLRPNTERPITCTHGTNFLLTKLNKNMIVNRIDMAFKDMHPKSDYMIPFWDGKAAERIINILDKLL
jgi:UDP-N-acetylglucosamine 2-epimerase (non-hydrolysing)